MTRRRLTLATLNPRERGRLLEKPFAVDDRFDDRWWSGSYSPTSRRKFLSFHDVEGVEVARVQIEERRFAIGNQYPTVPRGTERYSQIEFIEVASDRRSCGIGTEVVALISGWSPRRLLAFSEADEFWRSTGWIEHASTERGYQTVFIEDDGSSPRLSH